MAQNVLFSHLVNFSADSDVVHVIKAATGHFERESLFAALLRVDETIERKNGNHSHSVM